MTMNDQGMGDGGGLPPTMPGELPGQEAKWPKVVGILSIVQGSLGVLLNACGGCFLLAGPSFLETMMRDLASKSTVKPKPGQNPLEAADTFALMKPWMGAQGVLVLVTLATSVWLLIAGISMVNRKPSSVGLHKGWAWTRLALSVVGLTLGIVSTVMTAAQQAEIKVTYGGNATATGVMTQGVVMAVVMTLAIMAYPVVVLVVLSKPWAKSEIERWRGEKAADEVDPFAKG